MAIAYGAITTTTSTTATTSLSLNHTAAGSDRLAVVILHVMRNSDAGIAVTAATYGGVAMTERATIENRHTAAGKTYRTSIYTFVAPATSSTAVAFTLDQNSLASAVAVMSFTGVDQTTPFDASATANVAVSNNCTVTLTTGVANAWVVGGTHLRGGDTDPFAAGTGVEEKYDLESGTDATGDIGAAGGYKETTSTGSYTLNWTAAAADTGVIAAISIRPAATGGPVAMSAAAAATSGATASLARAVPLSGTAAATSGATAALAVGNEVTISVAVAAGGDDAYQQATGGVVSLGGTALGVDNSSVYVGIIFRGLDIPPGAFISAARLNIFVAVSFTDTPHLTIRGETNPADFTTTAYSLSSRTKTTAAVTWNEDLAIPGAQWEASPDISAVIQEIVDSGWTEGDDLALFLIDNSAGGNFSFRPYEYGAEYAPVLDVTYSLATGALSGSSAATSGASGALAVARPLSGISAATSTATATAAVARSLSGAAAATSTASAALGLTAALSGTSAATSTATGALSLALPLAGSTTAASGGGAALGLALPLSGSSTATSTAGGAVALALPLAGSSTAASGASAALTVVGEQLALSGAAAATSGAAGALGLAQPISGAASATSTATAALGVGYPWPAQPRDHVNRRRRA
jgi:hypothetical protein